MGTPYVDHLVYTSWHRRNPLIDLTLKYANHQSAGRWVNDTALPVFDRPGVVRIFGTIEGASRQ